VGSTATRQNEEPLDVVDGLLDTTIIVDILRAYPPSQTWFSSVELDLGVTKFAWLEVIQGAISKRKQKRAIQILNSFILVPVELQDIDWAKVLANSELDMKDALIASVSYRLQVPLYTHNLKHMRSLIGHLAQKPY
jgi:predicted nucleic acid-binding protein